MRRLWAALARRFRRPAPVVLFAHRFDSRAVVNSIRLGGAVVWEVPLGAGLVVEAGQELRIEVAR